MLRARRLFLPGAVGTIAGAVLLAGCGASAAKPRSENTEISVSVSACGQGWRSGKAGPQRFVLRNTDTRSGEVDLVDARSGAVYAEVEPLAPGTTESLTASLGAGSYAFRCSMEDEPAVTGATVRLTGAAKGDTPAVRPVDQAQLIPASRSYQRYVIGKLPGLRQQVATLQADIDHGDLAAARRDWLPAHLAYERLGAAYDAFGAADAAINGLPDGLPEGITDPRWAGLHRIEYGLWHGQSAATLKPLAAHVVAAVQNLQTAFPNAQIDPLDIGIRAHEITENALEFSLSGRDDFGSHSDLATVAANLTGTKVVLDLVRPLLAARDPVLSSTDAQLAKTDGDLGALRVHGAYPALGALTRPQRELINGDVSQLAEDLAPVAAILEPRRTS